MATDERTIEPSALRALREKSGLSQEDLAERCREMGKPISKKAIYRYERGETSPTEKKAQWLAQALGVPTEALRRAPDESSTDEEALRSFGYRTIKIRLDRQSLLNLRLVAHHYGVLPFQVIEAAPWMFTLLAELSLSDRRHAVEKMSGSLDEIDRVVPDHLHEAVIGSARINDAIADEEESIRTRDLFGDLRCDSDWVFGFDRDVSNPFVDFVRRQVQEIGSDAIEADQCEFNGGQLPQWAVFESFLQKITNGDHWARYALEHEHVRIRDIRGDLLADDRAAERAAWLADQVPPEVRQKVEEEGQSNLQKLLEEFE